MSFGFATSTMFRMEFQAVGEVGDAPSGAAPRDDITESVYESYRDVDGGADVHTPTVFEGRVGRRSGKVQRVSTASASLNARNWKEADLMHFDAPSFQGVTQDERTHHAIFLDAQVLRELVRPFAELPSAGPHVVVDTEAKSESGSVLGGARAVTTRRLLPKGTLWRWMRFRG